jgi:anti-sigma B factor antagonist
MEGISIQIDQVGALNDISLMQISGYIDTTTFAELQQTLYQLIQEGKINFIIDLQAVQYVSSAGWGVFVGEIRGLREKGGDLKIIEMTDEVKEVFEMLEFNRILTNYDSLEEAIDDFDFCRAIEGREAVYSFNSQATQPIAQTMAPVESRVKEKPKSPPSSTTPLTDSELPLNEKIKKIVVENPSFGAWSIKRYLYSPRFGFVKIDFFRLRSVLRRLGLDTRGKRFRYYRSR